MKNQPFPRLSKFLAPPISYSDETFRQSVQGKVAVVTGSSYGIGEATARRLGQAGAKVLLLARSEERLTEVKERIEEAGGEAHVYTVDLRDPDSVEGVAQKILEDHGGVDIMVHNAGKSIKRSLHKSLDRAHDFERTMGVNYLGPVRLQLALLPTMMDKGGGQIINVSTIAVKMTPVAEWAAYNCSKTAFDQWLAAAVPELRRYKISCSSVYLGLVHTRMSAPTEAYAKLPGLTAEQAASILCRAITKRARVIQPWWLGPVRWFMMATERLTEPLQTLMLPR